MKRGTLGAAALLALTLAGCVQTPPSPTSPPSPKAPPVAKAAPTAASLPGWAGEDHRAAFEAYRAACGAAADPAAARVCREARAAGPLDEARARAFFETRFVAVAPAAEGVLTAYFSPTYEARRSPEAEFTAPVRPLPADLRLVAPYPDRAQIESAPADRPLAWMRPEDLFFLQVQGSGVLVFEDGQRAKALHAGVNGRPYVAIGRPMLDQGLLTASDTSAQAVHGWLAAHRGPEADAVMRLNPRYAFFALAPDDGRAPAGTAGVPLPARRAVAVDPAYHAMGELLWISADRPALTGAVAHYAGLAVALDTGSAIKGPERADLYLGAGPAAGEEAGRVRHTLHLYRLVPKTAAR